MTTKQKAEETEQSRTALLEMLEPGDTIHTVLRHVSSSGMTRWIDCYVLRDGEPHYLTFHVGRVVGESTNGAHEGVKQTGCGMDMGFGLVYSLSRRLWPDGFDCIATADDRWPGTRCPSNDHVNHRGDGAHPTHHTEGGYALNQRWL